MRNFVILAIILTGLGFLFFSANTGKSSSASEIGKIRILTNTEAQAVELRKLLERVGPVEAQEEMLSSGLPFTGQTHLLVHEVGNYIYDQYGPEGLPYCRDYFLSACYHGFILNTLGDYGMSGVAETMEVCNEASPGVSAQCAHAAGHGFVVWHDYDLIKALYMCDELGAKVNSPAGEFGHFNCYDGVFMENFWGIHGGVPSEKRWVSETDIYYPCTDERIPEKYLRGCWANQATSIYQSYKGDLRKTAEACDAVENKEYQDACYNNLFRQIHPLTGGHKEKVFSLCASATGKERQDECVITNMISYWSVGDREVPYEICQSVMGPLRGKCFDSLVGMINYHYQEKPEKTLYCDKITDTIYREKCKN